MTGKLKPKMKERKNSYWSYPYHYLFLNGEYSKLKYEYAVVLKGEYLAASIKPKEFSTALDDLVYFKDAGYYVCNIIYNREGGSIIYEKMSEV